MYYVALFEEGRFCTCLGGPIQTLPDAIDQLKKVASTLNAEEVKEYFGYRFDRAGTTCAVLVLDRWFMPIETEEDEA